MAQWIVRTPVEGHTGISAGVPFSDGVAVVDDTTQGPALRYFRSAGYLVSPSDHAPASAANSRAADAERPARAASKAAWLAWISAQLGADQLEHAEGLTKAQIIEEFG
jgi:hypothetical protein